LREPKEESFLKSEAINNQMKAQSESAMILNLFYMIFIRFFVLGMGEKKREKSSQPIIVIYVIILISPNTHEHN
jgi:uncharacterized membrane protein